MLRALRAGAPIAVLGSVDQLVEPTQPGLQRGEDAAPLRPRRDDDAEEGLIGRDADVYVDGRRAAERNELLARQLQVRDRGRAGERERRLHDPAAARRRHVARRPPRHEPPLARQHEREIGARRAACPIDDAVEVKHEHILHKAALSVTGRGGAAPRLSPRPHALLG